ncbi:tripartite motif-containing protein 10-like isoform X1 [Gopherus evgoodei]|uniref:tripartite motif-containing protein 10-like isoform X1 n=2 Tax=Gopherus evgoodei TaxID=1825980 RepID=UPI0011D0195F|nr:tripartite motif-containing protein 10-like isoform X1 [Gopherus evgoodei]
MDPWLVFPPRRTSTRSDYELSIDPRRKKLWEETGTAGMGWGENRRPDIPAAMASGTPVQEIQEETKCPICLEYLTDPVSIHWGHNFCRVCITQYCGTWTKGDYDPVCCPNCRARIRKVSLRNNYQLANIVEKIKQLDLKPGKENLCESHNKSLDLFCEEELEAVCVVCERSPEHRSHKVLLMEEAAPKYKEKCQVHLKTLRKEREKLLGFKVTGEEKSQEKLKQIQKERQKIISEFQQLLQFLEEQEQLLLAQLEKLDKEIVKIQNENITKLSEEISRLSELISKMERKCQKPATEFLQDVRNTLSRCEKGKFQQPLEISPELEKRLSDFFQKTIALMKTLREFKATLPSILETKRGESLGSLRLVNVTLDPDTAHPQLVLSEDRKSVRWEDTAQDLPNNPERFDTNLCVLGCEGFTSGKHYWEVSVGDGLYWAVGVVNESVSRKGRISCNPEKGIWAVECCWGHCQALTSPETPLPLSQVPSRLGVYLDCGRRQVTFFDAGDGAPIFAFPPASVTGGRIRPWFWVGWPGSQLRLWP